MWELLFLLLPVAALSGWYWGRRGGRLSLLSFTNGVPSEYFLGLTHLINEEPDRAERLFLELVSIGGEVATALKLLLVLYEQEKTGKTRLKRQKNYRH